MYWLETSDNFLRQ